MAYSETQLYFVRQYAVQDNEWKMIITERDGKLYKDDATLFCSLNDWEDRNDVSAEYPEVVNRFFDSYLRTYLEMEKMYDPGSTKKVRLSASEEERLRSLGYIQ